MKKLTKGISKIVRSKDRMVVHFGWGALPIPQVHSYVGDPLYDAYVAFYRWCRYFSHYKAMKRLGKEPNMSVDFGKISPEIVIRERRLAESLSEVDLFHILWKFT